MPSFSIPLSGLDADQQALSVVANNLSNMNTVGYKDQQVNFQDLFYQSLGTNGSGDSLQVGAGCSVGSVTSDFTAGDIESTGVATDAAINGNGFFITQQNGQTEYTRAGNLQVNNTGYLTTQAGQNVMGYPATNGVVSNAGLAPLQIGTGTVIPATATTNLQMSMNLNSDGGVGATYSSPMTVYDSLGTSHELTFNFTQTGANSWSYNATIPGADVGAGTALATVGSGTLTFDSNGNLATINGAAVSASTPNITGINLTGLSDGASPMSLSWTALDPSGNSLITQTSSASATSASTQNGFASGSLNSYAIQTNGTIEGQFSNGQSLILGQIAMAQFGNENGLSLVGGNSFQSTVASGQAVVGTAGSGGLGTLTGGSLEQSNVDMATEFSNMIVDQRGFEANAKVITAFDQISQDTINIEQGG
jgi:flagellar hook protein FlgE